MSRTPARPPSFASSFSFALLFAVSLASCSPRGSARLDGGSAHSADTEYALRSNLAHNAETYVGASYKYGAKGPRAFDCSGLTSQIFRDFGISLFGSSMSQAKQGEEVAVRRARAGDIVYFKNGTGRVNHVAIVVDNLGGEIVVIHATTSAGVIRENIMRSNYWSKRVAGARRVIDEPRPVASVY